MRGPADGPGEELVEIGRITKPWGVRGEVKVRVITDLPGRFHGLDGVWVHGGAVEPRWYRIESVKNLKGAVALRLEGVGSVEEAERLRDLEVAVPESERPPLDEDAWYVDELVGMEVVDEQGETVGKLRTVWQGGTQDVFEITSPDGPILLPAVKEFVRVVDTRAGRIVVRIPETADGEG